MSNSFARTLYYEMVLYYTHRYVQRKEKEKLGNVQNDK